MLFRAIIILSFAVATVAGQGYDYWTDERIRTRDVAELEKRGYGSLDTWNLVWILHSERPEVAALAAYLLTQQETDKDLAQKELHLEITKWRSPGLAVHIGGALATLGSCEWTSIAFPHLDEVDDIQQLGLAREMARCKDYRAWPWVKRHLFSKTTDNVLFGEAMAAAYRFEMMDTGKGRRFSMAAELAELLEVVSPERRAQVQRSLDQVQGDTWRGKPNYERLPTMPQKQ